MNGTTDSHGINTHSNKNTAPPLPTAKPIEYGPKQTLLPPLSRRGTGPGLIVVLPESGSFPAPGNTKIENGVPSVLTKWAEEGYAVVELQAGLSSFKSAISSALNELRKCAVCEPKEHVGLVNYDPNVWPQLASTVDGFPAIVGAVSYADVSDLTINTPFPIPSIHHLAGKSAKKLTRSARLTSYDYPAVKSYQFAVPFTPEFDYATEAVSHTRNLTFLKKLMGGPHFDLEAIWDEHCYYEFENRSVEHTMSTMVQEPYVNHVPTVSILIVESAQPLLTDTVVAHRWHWARQIDRFLSRRVHFQQPR
jgi:carboxymethylenebutenolidase